MIPITLNGEPTALDAPVPVAELVSTRAPLGRAVAVNGVVVPRSDHPTHLVAEGDVVEIVMAVAGG